MFFRSPCIELSREFELAAELLQARPVVLAAVDCTENPGTCREYGVISYPSVKVFRGLKDVTRYRGIRRAEQYVGIISLLLLFYMGCSAIGADN